MTEYILIYSKLESIFSCEKIEQDYKRYLNFQSKPKIEIISTNESDKTTKKILLLPSDILTLVSISVCKKYEGLNYMPLKLEVIVGDYVEFKQASFLKPVKCYAQMFYDIDSFLLSIDFVHPF